MLNNLLVEAGYPKFIGTGEAAVNAAIGFAVVFAGISLLVAIVALVGTIMQRTVKGKAVSQPVKKVAPPPVQAVESDEISEETVAVITAAIMAYYQAQGAKCEFRVRRIKKI